MNAACTPANQPAWINVCSLHDLVEHAGVDALIDAQQVAIFYLPSDPWPKAFLALGTLFLTTSA